jgi:uncharacterized protein
LDPVSSTERITLIDALRGFALAGVLLANMPWFTSYQYLTPEVTAGFPTFVPDRILSLLILFFVDTKFITLFSFLFGLGFAVQLMRAEERGVRVRPVYLRRMGVLLLFGLCHLVFLWSGDILTAYAILGFLLVLFVRRPERTLLIWGLILGGLIGLIEISAFTLLAGASPKGFETLYAETFETFTKGGYSDAVRGNVHLNLSFGGKMVLFLFPFVLGRFLLGFWAGRRRLFHDPEGNRRLLEKIRRWGWRVGVPVWTVTVVVAGLNLFRILPDDSRWLALFGLMPFGAIFLAAFYAAAFSLLYLNPVWKRRLDVFAPVGRMALTNYLCQSMVSVVVFYGWGLGLSARFPIGPTFYIPYWIVLFTAQVYFSRWWLSRFRFGPFEWLWRSITYMKRQPMRVT